MKVSTILKAKGDKVVTIRPESTVAIVVQQLRADRIGAIVVCEEAGVILGIISERDIVNGLAERGAEILSCGVSEFMSRSVVTCTPDDTVKQIMALMTYRRVRHLPVVDGGRLRGIVSIGDVVKNRLDELELEANVLRDAYIARG